LSTSPTPVGVVPDLFRGGAAVDLGVGGVLELLRHEGAGNLCGELAGARDGALHALRTGSEHELGAVRAQKVAALDAHRLRHGKQHLVAAGGGDHRESDAGVTAGRLDDGRLVGRDEPSLFGGVEHREPDAVFDAAAGVERLELADDGGAGALRDAAQLHERCAADEFGDVVGYLHSRLLCLAGAA
jgi:hypothetical protein